MISIFPQSQAKIFHLGYLLLLDAIDASDSEHGTVGAALLAKARDAGFKTSIDVVSEDSERFSKIIGPALKQVDYCILNEIEASKVTGVEVRRDGKLMEEGIEEASSKLFELGVTDLVAIHFPEGSYGQRSSGEKLRQGLVGPAQGLYQRCCGSRGCILFRRPSWCA